MRDVLELFGLAIKERASDLHITEGSPPLLRMDGKLTPTSLPPMTREECKQLVYSVLTDKQKARFEQELELDASLDVRDLGRFRVNVHSQRGSIEAAFRVVPTSIRSLKELGMPPVVGDLTRRPNGLVLLTGATGTGKTTTLAAMVDLINQEQQHHIVVIEDPIEYLHHNKQSIIKQREVYADTKSFAEALRHTLRQDPNVIVVGEMRDLETISTTLTAAETGHLVLATIHTPDAPQTIERIIDVFPPYQQQQVRLQLAAALQGVISQQLVPRVTGKGRVLAAEIMIATPGIRNMVRERATEQIRTAIQTGAQFGMKTMDKSLSELYESGVISYEEALNRARNLDELKRLMQIKR